jgi:VWFA-related protein
MDAPVSISRFFTTVALLFLPFLCLAQEVPTSTIHVQTQLVALDVTVATRDGKVVTDLKSSDFTILENGVPQVIQAIEPPSLHTTPSNVEINSTADLDKLGSAAVTVLVLDELNGTFEENGYSRYSIQRYLEAQPARLQEATALMVETNSGFRLLRDFTMDQTALLAALQHHSSEIPAKRMQGGMSGTAAMERVLFTMNSLEQIAKATQGYRGRKNVIWVGNALPGVNTQDMPAEDTQIINTTVQRTINILLAAHTVLYTIDPRANSSAQIDEAATIGALGAAGESYLSDPSKSDPFSAGQNFGIVANISGGDAISGHNDIAKVIRESINTGTNYYTLYYRPSTPRTSVTADDTAQQFRKLAVHVSRPGLVLSARLGYYDNTPPETLPATAESLATKDGTKLLTLDISSAILSSMAYTGLYVHALPTQDHSQMHIILRSSQLSWASTGNASPDRTTELVVAIATFDPKHHILSHHAYRVLGHLPSVGTGSPFANFIFPLSLPPNAQQLRVIVRDMGNGHIGSDDLSVAQTAGPSLKTR